MIVGEKGPGVVINARTCAWLERYAGLTVLRGRVRGVDPEISRELEEIRTAAIYWRRLAVRAEPSSAAGTEGAGKPEPATPSSQWLNSAQAADQLGISTRAVTKAIDEGRLPAKLVSGRWVIEAEDLAHFRAARARRAA